MRRAAFTLLVALAAALLMGGGVGGGARLMEGDGPFVLFLREPEGRISAEQAATIGSQQLETLVEELGGDYEVFWTNEPSPAEYARAREQMEQGPLPQWYVEGPGGVAGGVVPDFDTAMATVRRLGGAR